MANKKEHTLQNKTTVFILSAFLFIVQTTLGVLLSLQASQALTTSMKERMIDIARSAASMINGDELETLTADDADTPEYKRVDETLDKFRDSIGLKYIYCVKEVSDRLFVYTIDSDDEDPAEFGYPVVPVPAMYEAQQQGVAVATDKAYDDEWGRFYSAFAPVFNSSHEVVGLVGVDYEAEWFAQQTSKLIIIVAAVSFTSLILGIVIIIFISNQNRRKLTNLYSQLVLLKNNVKTLTHEIKRDSVLTEYEEDNELKSINNIGEIGDEIIVLQGELEKQIEIVRAQAYIDALTKAKNKLAYIERTKVFDKQILEGTANFLVVVFDLNGLKYINDNYGHECGDQAIVDVAGNLIEVFGENNLYRTGGDEFIALLENSDEKEVQRCFWRFDKLMYEINVFANKYEFTLGASKGFAIYNHDVDVQYKDVFKRADQEMYKDKADFYKKHNGEIKK